ncbi:MAG: glycoside hydrolase family 15 protein [Geminicoccaceae bacterium]
MALAIEDYALIGDCETAALVGRDGSIDWLCWPRFDSGACFAALLGGPEHGRWLIAPVEEPRKVVRRYRPGTLVLETEFQCASGTVVLVDFMPVRDRASNLVRLVVGQEGRVPMRIELALRFDYGSAVPWVVRADNGALRAVAGPDMVELATAVPLHGEGMRTVGRFEIAPDESRSFTLTYAPSHQPAPMPPDPFYALAATTARWRAWSGRCQEVGEWTELVRRSLITLKALIYAPTGGMVAAPTTSLPEQIGGPRNWDYRYCWLRDATLTLLALLNAGYTAEAVGWRDWLLRAVAGSPDQMQIMYGLAGERRLTEWEVPWLPGYEGSAPVRIGNGAHAQLQLDVYGELTDALHLARRGGLGPDHAGWALQRALLEHLETIWRQPDQGLWEVRGPPQHFTYSKVMAWVAFDRAVRDAEELKLDGPVDRWRGVRDTIHAEVCAQGFDLRLGSFVQAYGSPHLDASLLLLPETGFLPPEDERIRGTIAAIERALVADGLVLRYDTAQVEDGLPAGEGAFLPCTCWLADAYVMLGRLDEARSVFERVVALCNDVGLLSEEYDPARRRQVGNFPQAFSHLTLAQTAMNLARSSKPAEQRAHRQAMQPGAESD